jgi:hypothetical protein
VPVEYQFAEITASDNGLVSCSVSPDGKHHDWTFEGSIRKEPERFARPKGIAFRVAARVLAETALGGMAR